MQCKKKPNELKAMSVNQSNFVQEIECINCVNEETSQHPNFFLLYAACVLRRSQAEPFSQRNR